MLVTCIRVRRLHMTALLRTYAEHASCTVELLLTR